MEELRRFKVLHGQIFVPNDEIRTDTGKPSAYGI